MLRPLVAALSLALLAPLAHASSWSLVSVVETPANTRDALPLRKGTPNSALTWSNATSPPTRQGPS